MFHVKSRLKTWDSVLGQCGGLAAVGALDGLALCSLTHQGLQAFGAEHVEAVEEFGVSVAVQADGTGELVLHYLQSILDSCEARSGRWELGSHCLGRKSTPCEDRSTTAQSTG